MPIRRFAHRLAIEHDRLDDALDDLHRFLRAGNTTAARNRLARFTTRFERYIHGEERLLFPVLEGGKRSHLAPTAQMRREHGFLRRLVAAVRDALHRDDHAQSLDALGSLRSVFLLHHAKEEWLIHPRLVETVTPATEDAVVRWLNEP
jgi:hemerythrin-like domain-containing protein